MGGGGNQKHDVGEGRVLERGGGLSRVGAYCVWGGVGGWGGERNGRRGTGWGLEEGWIMFGGAGERDIVGYKKPNQNKKHLSSACHGSH